MEKHAKFKPDPSLKLMDQIRQVLRYHHYALRTEKTYCDWILRYIRFHGAKKHPKHMGKTEIESFLSHLAVNRNQSECRRFNSEAGFKRHYIPLPSCLGYARRGEA